MKFYTHHIGDYVQATAHLSFVEDSAYGRLIRKYYADEKPLPADPKIVQRIVGARSKEEREAVVRVLQEFFVLADDGWHNKRCDGEIAKYREKQAKARMSALSRWTGDGPYEADITASEGNADAMRTHSEGNANHKPITINQEPLTKEEEQEHDHPAGEGVRAKPSKPLAYPAAFEAFWHAYPRKVGKLAALRAWERACKVIGPDAHERLTDAASKYAGTVMHTEERFIAHAQTWLNGGRWEDQQVPPVKKHLTGVNKFGVGG